MSLDDQTVAAAEHDGLRGEDWHFDGGFGKAWLDCGRREVLAACQAQWNWAKYQENVGQKNNISDAMLHQKWNEIIRKVECFQKLRKALLDNLRKLEHLHLGRKYPETR